MIDLIAYALIAALPAFAEPALDIGQAQPGNPVAQVQNFGESAAPSAVPDFNPAFSFSVKKGASGGALDGCQEGWVCDASCIYLSLDIWICHADVDSGCPVFDCYEDTGLVADTKGAAKICSSSRLHD